MIVVSDSTDEDESDTLDSGLARKRSFSEVSKTSPKLAVSLIDDVLILLSNE